MSDLAVSGIDLLKKWLWKRLSHSMHLHYRLRSGIKVNISSFAEWCIYNDVFVSGEYDQAIQAAISRAQSTGNLRVVDIGANVGYFTLRVFDLIGRSSISIPHIDCLLLEASPHLERSIRGHVGQLQRDGVQIKVVIGLVGKKSGTANFEIRPSESGNQVVGEPTARSHKLAYYDLDESLAEVAAIDLLKCDIEGSEKELLEELSAPVQEDRRGSH